MSDKTFTDRVATDVTKQLVDQGKLIEAGFAALRHLAIPKDAPPLQIEEMRLAFMAGAEHLFSSIMVTLDEDAEPTEKDLERMNLIHAELDRWRAEFKKRMR